MKMLKELGELFSDTKPIVGEVNPDMDKRCSDLYRECLGLIRNKTPDRSMSGIAFSLLMFCVLGDFAYNEDRLTARELQTQWRDSYNLRLDGFPITVNLLAAGGVRLESADRLFISVFGKSDFLELSKKGGRIWKIVEGKDFRGPQPAEIDYFYFRKVVDEINLSVTRGSEAA